MPYAGVMNTVKPATRGYHHGDLRNACMRCALALLEEGGLESVTLRAVAERAGVSRSAPYRHFPTKRALLAAAAAAGFRGLHTAITEARDNAGDDPRARLMAGCAAYARFGTAHPHLYRLMFAGDFDEGPLFDNRPAAEDAEFPELIEAGNETYDLLVEELTEAQQQGVLRPREPRTQALAVWSMMHGVMSLYLDNRTSYGHHETAALEAVLKGVLEIAFEGLAIPAPADPAVPRAREREPGKDE